MAHLSAGSWSRWAAAGALLLASAAAGARADGPGGAGGAAQNEPDARLVELGRRLFFEPALSAVGERSCASCHDPAHGFSDPAVRSVDDDGPTPRHSQALIDVDAATGLHWDGGIADLNEIAHRRMTAPSGGGYEPGAAEMSLLAGRSSTAQPESQVQRDLGPHVVVTRNLLPFATSTEFSPVLRLGVRYQAAMAAARAPQQRIDNLCKEALAAYVTSLRSNSSPYDRFLGGEKAAISESARRGLELFRGRAGCAECHKLGVEGKRAPLRDGQFHNTGIAWLGRPDKTRVKVVLDEGIDADRALRMPPQFEGDLGRGLHAPQLKNARAFKTPTLRDVARHPPYMHDGSLASLAAVVRHYARGCGDDARRDPRLKGFEASETDVADLVAFLEALTSNVRPGRADRPWARRSPSTRLRFVDAAGRPMAGLAITATPAGDLAGGDDAPSKPFALTTDDSGEVKFDTTPFTHVRLELVNGLSVRDGSWIPDTCREATLVVPVSGTARLSLLMPIGLKAPDELRLWPKSGQAGLVVLEHPVDHDAEDSEIRITEGPVRPVRAVLVEPTPWRFVRERSLDVGRNRSALYVGWCPDGNRKMLFRLEGQTKPQSVELAPDETVHVAVVP